MATESKHMGVQADAELVDAFDRLIERHHLTRSIALRKLVAHAVWRDDLTWLFKADQPAETATKGEVDPG